MSSCIKIAFICLAVVGGSSWLAARLAAQTDDADDSHHFHHNHVAIFLGGTTPFNEEAGGKTSLTIGADYECRFTPAVGAIGLADFALGDHKRTALFAAMISYRPLEALRLAAGPGFELVEQDVSSGGTTTTKHKFYFVMATRVGYEFHVGKFSLSPTLGLDFVGETKTGFVYGLAVEYGF